MKAKSVKIRDEIVWFQGRISRNLMLDPMVSHAYFVEDGDEAIIFDPSCGQEIAKEIEAHIRSRRKAQAEWRKAILIAGHSHMDHANNFYLSDVMGAQETHVFIHERGFQDGRVMNEPMAFMGKVVEESRKYYNPYMTFPVPYNLFMYPLAALNALSPALAAKVFSLIGAIPWPRPVKR